jgi:hypothetical protein
MFAISTLVHGEGSIDLFNYLTKILTWNFTT